MPNISGTIDKVITQDRETRFAIVRLQLTSGKTETVLGNLSTADEGLWVEADGEWAHHQKHGKQFKASNTRVFQPRGADGIERFLASGSVQGVGKHFAKKIVSRFGDKTLDIILKRPWEMKYLKGVGPKRIAAVKEGVKAYQNDLETMAFLHERFGPDRAAAVFQKYGKEADAVIKRNPYQLIEDVSGIGFKLADDIARGVGVAADHPLRVRAAVIHVLNEASKSGHTCVPEPALKKRLKALLQPPPGLADEAVGMLERNEFKGVSTFEDDVGEVHIEFTRNKVREIQVAKRLWEITDAPTNCSGIDTSKAILWASAQCQLTFEADQASAIATAIDNKVAIITGGPGVGKTTILKALILIFAAKRYRIALAAPTGRAARRLAESSNRDASTIHRLLGKKPGRKGYARNRKSPLEIDALIIDEASMVDLPLFRALLDALPDHARMILVGDKDQLPSVGPGQVLGDLIASEQFPVARLRKPRRQAEGSKVIQNTRLINAGLLPDVENTDPAWCFLETTGPEDTASKIEYLMTTHLPMQGINTKDCVQVLVPLNRGAAGLFEMNKALQNGLNGGQAKLIEYRGKTFRLNDRVTQRKNNLKLDVSNGDSGKIVDVNMVDRTLLVDYQGREVAYTESDLSELDLGYAITIHRSQGSEYSIVIVAMDTAATVLLDRKLLYTACTRAQEKVIIVGQKRAINICISDSKASERNTLLSKRIAGGRR